MCGLQSSQERREDELDIEAARMAVIAARRDGQEPDAKNVKLAEECILPDETKDPKVECKGTVSVVLGFWNTPRPCEINGYHLRGGP